MRFTIAYFVLLFLFTATLYSQTRRPASYIDAEAVQVLITNGEIANAVQNQRLDVIEKEETAAKVRMDALSISISDLTSTMNRFTGIGIGLGIALTVLQGLQVILQVKAKKST